MATYLRSLKSDCKNCYKCIRHCPVKSIQFSGNQAHIMHDECILCGQCYTICPQNAKIIREDTEVAKVLLEENEKVLVSLAPSFTAYFEGANLAAMRTALQKLGFAGVEETALGATLVKQEYDRLVEAGPEEPIISSCCPSVNLMIQKYYPQALPYLAKVASPMQVHCALLKQTQPEAKTVFIGPCIAKKAEADTEPNTVDCVLTFEELGHWLEAEGVAIEAQEEAIPAGRARYFPTCGGILKSMECKNSDITYFAVDGMENCKAVLEDVIGGNLSRCFIEMSSCAGSCAGGPAMGKGKTAPVQRYMSICKYAGQQDFDVPAVGTEVMEKSWPFLVVPSPRPGTAVIEEILRKMGKNSPEDELNCGSCGYNTCRDKALAIHQGKANTSMCLPFLKDKAENFSDIVITNSPNGIIVLNEALEVQQINNAALAIMGLESPDLVMGEPVIRVLDPQIFAEALEAEDAILNRRVYLAEYRRYVDQTVLYDASYHILMCIMRDVTEEEETREAREAMSRKTIETANQVVEKQMRAVQEIASLLGETTAETKIALTKLKESFSDE